MMHRLVQIGRIDGPTEYFVKMLTAIEFLFSGWLPRTLFGLTNCFKYLPTKEFTYSCLKKSSSQGQNLALTLELVPNLLNSGSGGRLDSGVNLILAFRRYRGTSLIRNRPPLQPFSSSMPGSLCRSYGGGRLLMFEVPLYRRQFSRGHSAGCGIA